MCQISTTLRNNILVSLLCGGGSFLLLCVPTAITGGQLLLTLGLSIMSLSQFGLAYSLYKKVK